MREQLFFCTYPSQRSNALVGQGPRVRKSWIAPLLLLLLWAGACRQNQAEGQAVVRDADALNQARDQVLGQISQRAARLNDYTLVGERCLRDCASASPATQHFSLQVRAPGLFQIQLPDNQQVISFDGLVMSSVDHSAHTVKQIAVAAVKAPPPDAANADARAQVAAKTSPNPQALLPYQTLGAFVVEGWRAPLLNTAQRVPVRWDRLSKPGDSAQRQGKRLVLERMLDDAQLLKVEYVYQLPDAHFVEKRFIGKDQKIVKRVVVDKNFSENQGRDYFPKAWRELDSHNAVLSWTQIDAIELNKGLSKQHFQANVPADYVPLP